MNENLTDLNGFHELEARYQNMMRRDFKIIRAEVNPYRIERKNKGRRGWYTVETFDSLRKMTSRLIELGSEDKTIIDNQQ